MTPEQLLATNGIKLDSTAPGRHYATCPKCSATRSRAHQGNKVLGVTIEADGSVRWGCNHCGWTGPEKGVGGNGHQAGFAATYNYRDTNGNVLFQKVRNPPGHAPRFWLRRPDGRGGWINDTKGVNTKIIYRADDVAKAIADGRIVVVVEGEKDVDNVAAIGFTATCNAHGASELGKRPKWTRAHSEQLRGADIVVLNDNDSAGYAHADTTCRFSLGVAKRVRRLDLKPHWPDMPKGHDISDWLALGHTRAELDPLIAAAPDYQPEANEQAPTAGNAIDDAVEIEKLARMPAIEYDRERKAAGKRLGLSRLSLLDALVKAKRAELGFDADDGKQGHAIEFATPEPWPDSVDGAELLNGLAKAVRKYVALSDFARDTTALWTLHTYLIDRFLVSPRLGIHSPTKQCGKTTLLDILSRLALRSLSTANVTCAAIFRVIEGYQPTLLVDEADTFLHDNDELRGVLNGNRKGSQVLRTVGDDFEVRAFATYSACAIALIGSLPDTLHDRAVGIALKRRLPSEKVEPYRPDRADHLDVLARKAARWAHDHADAIGGADPEMPAGIINREADNWRPLLAIADEAGREWPERARKAAEAAHVAAADDGASRLELLLGDIRDIFIPKNEKGEPIKERAAAEMPSADLVKALVALEGRPWAELGKNRKPLTQNGLARRLKSPGIIPKNVGPEDARVRGYILADFKEAFERYLAPEGASQPPIRPERDEIRTSDISQPHSPDPGCAVGKFKKPDNDGLLDGCAVGKGESGQNERAEGGSGLAPGLSRRTLADLAHDYTERAYANAQENEGDTRTAELDAWLRQRLAAEGVLPEFVEVEFQRVMTEVFRV
jgi:uncharacterized protein DUF3631